MFLHFLFFFFQLKTKLKNAVSMLRGSIEGSPQYLSIRFRVIVPLIMKNLRSVLASNDLCDLFIKLRLCVFSASSKNDVFGIFIAHLILRYQTPLCVLNKEWTAEDIS